MFQIALYKKKGGDAAQILLVVLETFVLSEVANSTISLKQILLALGCSK